MRLVLVTHKVVKGDGQGRVNLEIVRAALGRRWHVTVVASGIDPGLQEHPSLLWLSVPVGGWPTELLRNQVFAVRSAAQLRRLNRTPDAILVNGFITWAPAQVNVAHFVHGAWMCSPAYPYARWWRSPYAAYQRLYSALNARLERRAFAHAQCVVAVAEKTAGELCEIGIPAKKIVTIHNGVDTEEFHPGPSDRAKWGLPATAPLFLFAGDLRTRRKGLDTVLRALALTPRGHLVVAGALRDSPFPGLATRLGVSGRVHWLGFERDMPALMRTADVFVLPSRYESMSLAILEAMASGAPVLTARTAGGAELLGVGGRVMDDPEDVTTLARWMTELSSDPELRRRMGNSGRTIAEAHTWKQMADTYLDLIESLA